MSELKTATSQVKGQLVQRSKYMSSTWFGHGKLHCAAGCQELLRDVTPSLLQIVQSLFGKPQSELA